MRTDLGDSIKKAFAGIPTMLQEMGLESTPENERAVRILGYNRMEITEESIAQIKDWDAEVNTCLLYTSTARFFPSGIFESFG